MGQRLRLINAIEAMEPFWIAVLIALFVGIVTALVLCYKASSDNQRKNKDENRGIRPTGSMNTNVGAQVHEAPTQSPPSESMPPPSKAEENKRKSKDSDRLCDCEFGETTHKSKLIILCDNLWVLT